MPRQTCTGKSSGEFIDPAGQNHRYPKIGKESLPQAGQIQPENEGLRAVSQAG
jgi:hypothetical protein